MEERNTEGAASVSDVARPLRRGVARAALASGATEATSRVLMVALSIATARALLPGQVGVLGLAVIVVGIVSLIAACSETAGVIGRYDGSDTQHAVAATLVRGSIVAILVAGLYISLPVIPRLLTGAESAESNLAQLLRVLLLIPVLELAACYPRVLLQRKLDLAYIAGVNLFQTGTQVGLSVVLLWRGYGAAGIVWSSVLSAALGTAAVWLRVLRVQRSRWVGMPEARLRRNTLLSTAKVFAGGFVGYLNGRVDNLLVAGAIGPTAMSFYGMAWSASRIAPQILGQAVGFVLVPALAQIQADRERVGRALRESLRHSYLLLAPLSAGLFVSAPLTVTAVLGSKWLPMVPCLQVMSITVLATPICNAANALLIATGRAHVVGLASAGQLIVLAAVIVPLSRTWGIVGAAYGDMLAVSALTIAFLVLTPAFRRMLRRGMVSSILVPVLAALAAGFLAFGASAQVIHPTVKLLTQIVALLVGYPAVLSLLGGTAALRDLILLLRNVSHRVDAAAGVSALNPQPKAEPIN
jgi:O-antigen/teichoic acid export membrane protein